ncbi:AAHS family benzoate transporter-like MFS transporter/AAHS family 4-hydroxybenzoate transporter-like MFS transporter [Nitrospirillum amazonense]|uniref:AAHS family benzoate transporter-like MFS transporter/AAHS family 4-hydroxybenzoate transporter-like MFS transporter n=1 Tax=Nitrospirillum amazonense TaxID=28077 RepID=A0A560JHP1_9PROT|nr:MFS transporter [Nitrospirillum amazonense]TWB70711.1 AAHS family benzoate transporter-like MFS transporter/AAHS family 4-hydroxybenzoate transporter-like MFS transporter [Nitrospirillum amazonense]
MATAVNAAEELATAPMGIFHRRFALLMGLIMFFDGYDLFNAAYVIPLVRRSWQPSPSLIGIMLSAGIFGLAIGSVLQGLLADRYGRRRVLVAALWLLMAANLVLALVVQGPVAFAVCRLVLGLALGMVTPLVLTYLNEWTPARCANTYVTWVFQLGLSLGGICAGLAGVFLTAVHGWQALYYTGALSGLVAVAATLWLPESVQYLALKGDFGQVRRLLAALRPDRAWLYDTAALVHPRRAPKAAVGVLLAPIYRRNTLVHWAVGFLSLFCVHGLTGWLPTIVVARGAAVSSAFAYGTLIMVASIFGGMAAGWLADHWRSRVKTMAGGYLLAVLAMAGLGVVSGGPATVALVAAAGFCIFGAQAVLNNYQAMTYHTEVRGTGLGVAVGLNRVGGILGPSVIGVIGTLSADPLYVFLVLAAAALLAGLISLLGGAEVTAARRQGASSAAMHDDAVARAACAPSPR